MKSNIHYIKCASSQHKRIPKIPPSLKPSDPSSEGHEIQKVESYIVRHPKYKYIHSITDCLQCANDIFLNLSESNISTKYIPSTLMHMRNTNLLF